LPNVVPSLVILAALEIGRMMLLESALSFLGLGIRPPNPSWGSMLADGRAYVASAWWLSTCPGLAVSFTVLSLNIIADRLRDALDSSLEV
jgi:peptide/nickel transport system permease protein